ncbi:TolC family protein [Mucilaginibacter sp. cycad4]|uniref:TolC family protein n=1 Tax=Mucilaginibacter sp. cycad4 TaxID=3342096 RepID=UPI002AAC211D|nr:TolC family protein [Mucilaginibacter gossypii]WPV01557.1 TolC family protein [Mucilaginibacter gossypii]
MKKIIKYGLFVLLLPARVAAQGTGLHVLSINDLFDLAEKNSKTLAISRQNIEASGQRTEIAKSAKLPEISAGISAGYIGNITILNPNFSFNETVPAPHFTNDYTLEASQVLYSGSSINNNIKKAKLQEQLAGLTYEENRETIRLLLVGKYLELYRLFNQKKVYAKNIELAKARLKNIQGLHIEGMVTKNDMIRSQLQITDLDVLAEQVDNNIAIINKELTVTLGLPDGLQIGVDTTIAANKLETVNFNEYLNRAYAFRPAVKANTINESIADKNISLAKAEKLPKLGLYAGDGLSRPYLNILPPQDIYYNVYQAGIRLTYNVSSLYHAKDKIRLAQIERSQQQSYSEQVKQQAELDVNAAFIKFNEAKTEMVRRQQAQLLADDNYRIVEKKYLNQLALLTDILDASSAKLTTELNRANAGINILYQWYALQKATGKL